MTQQPHTVALPVDLLVHVSPQDRPGDPVLVEYLEKFIGIGNHLRVDPARADLDRLMVQADQRVATLGTRGLQDCIQQGQFVIAQ